MYVYVYLEKEIVYINEIQYELLSLTRQFDSKIKNSKRVINTIVNGDIEQGTPTSLATGTISISNYERKRTSKNENNLFCKVYNFLLEFLYG